MFSRAFIVNSSKYIASILVLILIMSMIPMVTTAGSPPAPLTDKLNVIGELDLAPPPATYNPPVNNFGLMGVQLQGQAGPNILVNINSITITHTGSGAASDVQVSIYDDINTNNVFESGVDPQRGPTTAFTGNQATITTTGLQYDKGIKYIWVAYDFASVATGTHGCEITLTTDISEASGGGVFFVLPNSPPNSSMVPRAALPPIDFTVDSVITYNATPAQTKQFYSGEIVTVRCNVSHNWGQANIQTADITIKNPAGTDIVTNQSMVKLPTPQGPNYRVFQYNHNLLTPSPRGQYWAWTFVDGLGLGGTPIANFSKNDFFVLNKPPQILGPIPDQYGNEDQSWNLDLSLNKTDLEDSGGALFWNVTNINSPLSSIDIVGNVLTFNLLPETSGSDQVTLVLEDSDGAQASTQFWVYVNPVDDIPEITPSIPNQEKLEDSPNWTLDLTPYKFDAEDPAAQLTWGVYDVDDTLYTVDLNGDILEFGVVPDANGNNLMHINLTDTANQVDVQGVWVNLTPVNDPPVWAPIAKVVVTENETQDVLALRDYLSDIDTAEWNLVLDMVSNSNSENINVSIDVNDKVDVKLEYENYSGFAVINVSAYDGEDYAYHKFSVISIIGDVVSSLRSPSNDSTVTTLSPKLLWSSAIPSGFEDLELVFDVYLDTNATNVTDLNVSTLVSESQTDESHSPVSPLEDQSVYYWTVIPKLIDSVGFEVLKGFCIDGVWNFTVDIFAPNSPPNVLLKSPANQTAVNSTTVELVWEAFDANGDWPLFYDIYLGPDKSNMIKIVENTALSETNYTVIDLQEDAVYYWTVIPHDGVLTGVCQDGIWEFAINAENQVPIVTLQAPPDKSQTGLNPELRWTMEDTDPFDNVTYSIYIGESESTVTQYNTSALLRKDYITTTYKLTIPLVEGKTYYWTILPRDKLENGTCVSGVWSFEVNTTITNQPPTVFLISPRDNMTVETETGTVELRWKGNDPDGDNVTYTLYYGTNKTLVEGLNATNATVQKVTDITEESYDLTNLDNNTVYYWTLIPNDGEFNGICLNGTWKFKVIIVEVVEPPIPPGENYLFTLDPTYKENLNAGNLSTDLKDAFAAKSQPLTANAVLTTETDGWKITDGDNIYEIKEEDGNLNVYKAAAPPTKKDDDDGLDRVLVIGLIMVVIIVVLVIVMMVMAKRKKPVEAAPIDEREIPTALVAPAVEPAEGEEGAPEGEEAAEGEGEAPAVAVEAAPTVGLLPEQVAPGEEQPPVEGAEAEAAPVAAAAPAAAAAVPEGEEAPSEEAETPAAVEETVVAAPAVAAAATPTPTPVPTPAVEEMPILDSKPTACPQCSAENIEFGENNTGTCVVCDYQFTWNE